MKTPTIYDIKYDTQEKSPYFFSRKTMIHFEQQLKDFHVRKSPSGKIFIYAPGYYHGKLCGYTFREYINHDLILCDWKTAFSLRDLNAILDYIQSH